MLIPNILICVGLILTCQHVLNFYFVLLPIFIGRIGICRKKAHSDSFDQIHCCD